MNSGSALGRGDMESLLLAITSQEHQAVELSQRRVILLNQLASMIDAAGGFWGWGRGRPGITAVAPVASIPFGFSDSEWASVAQFCMSLEGQRMTQEPIFQRLRTSRQATVTRQEIVDDDVWNDSSVYRLHLRPARMDDFLTSVRYCSDDLWCCLTFFSRLHKPRFQPRDSALIDLAMSGVAWLPPRVSESIPAEAFDKITSRQRLVMLFLLDGLSRKQIANNLGLTLHTVNDHVKSLYERFGVQSATELAARFLKSV